MDVGEMQRKLAVWSTEDLAAVKGEGRGCTSHRLPKA